MRSTEPAFGPALNEMETLQARIEALEFAMSALLASRCGDTQLQTTLEVQGALISELLQDQSYLNSPAQRKKVHQYFVELAWAAWERGQPPMSTFHRNNS